MIQGNAPADARTIIDVLAARAVETPDDLAYAAMTRDGVAESIDYRTLARRAAGVAKVVRDASPPEQDEQRPIGPRVMLATTPGPRFVEAFLGCLMAGAVAVPVYPRFDARAARRLTDIARDCSAALVVSEPAMLAACQDLLPPSLRVVGVGPDHLAALPDTATTQPEALALLQYTSGSTRTPRGVMVSHDNLMVNQRMIRAAFRHDADTRVVSWLPTYHDMGLIGGVLQPLFLGVPCGLLTPWDFLREPVTWLRAVSDFAATTSGGPDFAYQLCAERLTREQVAGLDLSSWRVAFNGAEPVRAVTLDRFAKVCEPAGFDRSAFVPCYGLAEATLLVSASEPGRPEIVTVSRAGLTAHRAVPPALGEPAQDLVSVGVAPDGQVRIEDESGRELPVGAVGEVVVRGPHVARGYWTDDAENRGTFPAPQTLRTGDLGFVTGGALFITGRIKDLIVVRGRNLYPQDLEWTACTAHPDVRPGGVVAFGADDGTQERVAIIAEVRRNRTATDGDVREAIRSAVTAEHGVALYDTVLVAPGKLPRTTSGKLRRTAAARRFGLAPVPAAAAASYDDRATGLVAALLSEVGLAIEPGSQERTLAGLGLDSLAAVSLQQHLHNRGVGLVPLRTLLGGMTVAQLASLMDGHPTDGAAPPADMRTHTGSALTPVARYRASLGQQALWLLSQVANDTATTITRSFAVVGDLDIARLDRALALVAARHEALRTSFTAGVHSVDAQVSPDAGLRVEQCEDPDTVVFDLERGPLLRILLSGQPGGQRLVFHAHHTIVDLRSLVRLLDEIRIGYDDPDALARLAPPPPFSAHAAAEHDLLEHPNGAALRSRWRERLRGAGGYLDLPSRRVGAGTRGHGTNREAAGIAWHLDAGTTQRLRAAAASLDVLLPSVVLFAFAALLRSYGAPQRFLIGSPVAGRVDAHSAHTVGYLVNVVLLRMAVGDTATAADVIRSTHRELIEALDLSALPFPAVVEAIGGTRQSDRPPMSDVLFSYQRGGSAALDAITVGVGGIEIPLGPAVLRSFPHTDDSTVYELDLAVAEHDGLTGYLKYRTARWSPDFAARFSANLEHLLATLPDVLDCTVAELPVVNPDELARLSRWERGERLPRPLDDADTVVDLLVAQAQTRPDATAVETDSGAALGYGALVVRAALLARELKEKHELS